MRGVVRGGHRVFDFQDGIALVAVRTRMWPWAWVAVVSWRRRQGLRARALIIPVDTAETQDDAGLGVENKSSRL